MNLCPLCRTSMRLWALDWRRSLPAETRRLALRTATSFRDECLHTDHAKYEALVAKLNTLSFKPGWLGMSIWQEIERIKNCHGGHKPVGRTFLAWTSRFARAAAFVLLFSLPAAAEIPAKFFRAIHTVETSGRTGPILGDGGRALGPYQIHRAYWQDANVPGTYAQVANEPYARRVVTAYLTRYAREAVATGDFETLARVHNGGPRGHQRSSTLPYWHRVRRHLGAQP